MNPRARVPWSLVVRTATSLRCAADIAERSNLLNLSKDLRELAEHWQARVDHAKELQKPPPNYEVIR